MRKYNEGLQLIAWMWGFFLCTAGAASVFAVTGVLVYYRMYWHAAGALIGGSFALYVAGHLMEWATRW